MKKILLISNKVMHYRSQIYNSFYDQFAEHGFEFHVVSNNYQEVSFDIHYKKHVLDFSVLSYIRFINELNPDICINFLHLKDKMIIPLTLYCRSKNIPMIYWGHGINLKTPNAVIKNLIFHFIHSISNALIIYSEEQLKYIWKCNWKKTFVAHNTLDFSNVDLNKVATPNDVKQKYGIKERKVLLYISRILPYKGLDILLELFKNEKELALVVVGGGINDSQLRRIDETPHFYYLGEKYGNDVDEIYNMGDVFSTPGHIGLAVNQAMFWGKPIVVLNRIHAPEIVYVHNGENSYIVETPEALHNTIMELVTNQNLYQRVSINARHTFETEMGIDKMFNGFLEAIKYCESLR